MYLCFSKPKLLAKGPKKKELVYLGQNDLWGMKLILPLWKRIVFATTMPIRYSATYTGRRVKTCPKCKRGKKKMCQNVTKSRLSLFFLRKIAGPLINLIFFLFHYRNGGRQRCVRNFAVRRSRSGFQSGNKKSQLYSLKLPVNSVAMGQK